MIVEQEKYPNLAHFAAVQLSVSPGQERFFKKRFDLASDAEMESLEVLADCVKKLIEDDAETYARDYEWVCQEQLAEELYFRRNGKYRLSSFQEAYDQVYSNEAYMSRYMNGLLFSQLWWSNHANVMNYYIDTFLANLPDQADHLEIGPGHGLFLFLAGKSDKIKSLTGWDISPASIDATTHALKALGTNVMPNLTLVDMFDNPTGSFDSIVFSEVLEHMETPGEALNVLRSLLSDRGQLFINMPINSPAPDHIFNKDKPEDLRTFVEDHGLKVISEAFFPATNQTLEKALRKKMSVNCVFICEKA